MKDGESVVIGGMMMTNRSDSESSIPWLGEVPIFASIFGGTGVDMTETQLIIMVTATLIQPMPAGSEPTLPFDRVARSR